MDFYKGFRGLILCKLKATNEFICLNKATRQIEKQGNFAECNEYFDTFVKGNSNN